MEYDIGAAILWSREIFLKGLVKKWIIYGHLSVVSSGFTKKYTLAKTYKKVSVIPFFKQKELI